MSEREPSRGTICKCGLAKSYHGGSQGVTDHEYEPRYPARRAASSEGPGLDELRTLSDEATPGPWVAQSSDDGESVPWWIDTHAYEEGPEPVWAPPQAPVSTADVALMVAAVNYVRARLASKPAEQEDGA